MTSSPARRSPRLAEAIGEAQVGAGGSTSSTTLHPKKSKSLKVKMVKPNKHQLVEIDHFFKDYVFSWIIGDLSLVIAPREGNNLAFTILCFAHMEFLGSFITGQSKLGSSTDNTAAFLKYMSEVTGIAEYGAKAYTLTECFRNGLVHHYMYGKVGIPFGVQRAFLPRAEAAHLKFEPQYNDEKKCTVIISFINVYHLFEDFKYAVEQFYEDVRSGKKFDNFDKRLKKIREERDKGFQSVYVANAKIKSEWPEHFGVQQ